MPERSEAKRRTEAIVTTHLSEGFHHPFVNLLIRDPVVVWPRVDVVARRVVFFLRERADSVPLEYVVSGIVFADSGEKFFRRRGSVEKVSPTSAFCLFRVGRRVGALKGLGVFFSDVGSTILELSPTGSDDDDVRMTTVSVEGLHVSLERSAVDDDAMEVDASVIMRFLCNLAPVELGRRVFKECKEIFFGEPFSLGISEEELFGTETGLTSSARHLGTESWL